MNMVEALKEQLRENPWSDELSEEWEVMVDGDWTDNHKFEYKTDIIKHLPTGTLYEAGFQRTGDYWQGYETAFDWAHKVKPVEVLVIQYVEDLGDE